MDCSRGGRGGKSVCVGELRGNGCLHFFFFFFFKIRVGIFFCLVEKTSQLASGLGFAQQRIAARHSRALSHVKCQPPHHHSTTPLMLIGSLQLSQTGSDWLAFSVTDGLSILHHTLLFVLFCLFFFGNGSPRAKHSIWALYGLQRENIDIWQEQVNFLFNPFIDGESEVRNLNSANYLFRWAFISQAWHKHFRWRLSICHSFAVKSSITRVRF